MTKVGELVDLRRRSGIKVLFFPVQMNGATEGGRRGMQQDDTFQCEAVTIPGENMGSS